jgi:hypothetical protein
MMIRMLLTFFCASSAGELTRFDHRPENVFIRSRTTRRKCSCSVAHIRAIQIETNALPQLLDHGFRKASICTGRAGLRACKAIVDALDQRLAKVAVHVRMRADHLFGVH